MSQKKSKRKLRREINGILSSKFDGSAFSDQLLYVGLVHNNGQWRVKIPDLQLVEYFSDERDMEENIQEKMKLKVMKSIVRGYGIPKARGANMLKPKSSEKYKLFAIKDPRIDYSEEEIKTIVNNVEKEERIQYAAQNHKEAYQFNPLGLDLVDEGSEIKEEVVNIETKPEEKKVIDLTIPIVPDKHGNGIEERENVKFERVGERGSTKYKYICPNCNKVFFLTPSKHYQNIIYHRKHPNSIPKCCCKKCSFEYRHKIKESTRNITEDDDNLSLFDQIIDIPTKKESSKFEASDGGMLFKDFVKMLRALGMHLEIKLDK